MTEIKKWYEINNTQEVISPSLLVYPERIKKNVEMMIKIAGGSEFLRPHIKTHKIAEIVKMQMEFGISKFKCATIAEAELLAKCKVKDILLAMQPVATNVKRFFKLIEKYPNSQFSTIVDNFNSVNEISQCALSNTLKIPLWLDINNGMNRTGIQPNQEALELYRTIHMNPNLIAKGFHVYDGHIHDTDLEKRRKVCDKDFEAVAKLKDKLESSGIKIKTIIAGGTPTFPIHKNRKGVEVSPGTPLLWDAGYGANYNDLKFLPAAVLLTRVISKPKPNLICLDLGHKSVASEMNFPRVKLLGKINCEQIGQSEEHLVVECKNENDFKIGDTLYAVPMHICPTVAKYKEVLTIIDGKVTGSWKIAARDQKMTF